MSDPTSKSIRRGGATVGYREVRYWRIGDQRRQMLAVGLATFLSLVPWLFLFSWFGSRVGQMPQSGDLGELEFLLILTGGVLTLALHELAHGLAMRASGAPVQYGVLWMRLLPYAAAPGHAFSRSAYILGGLAPLVGLSLLALLGMILLAGTPWVALLALYAACNAAGSCGDLWISGIILRYPPGALLIDERDGVRILLPV